MVLGVIEAQLKNEIAVYVFHFSAGGLAPFAFAIKLVIRVFQIVLKKVQGILSLRREA